MIVNEKINIKLNQQLKNSLGEKYKKYSVGEIIEISLTDLSKGSNLLIDAKCDNCGTLKSVSYKYYNNNVKNGNYFSCSRKCSNQKVVNTNFSKFGVENISQLEEIKIKKKETCFKNYGVESPAKNKEILDKIKISLKKTYSDNLEEIQNKMKKTNLERYGVEEPNNLDWVKEKIKKTFLEKYGVENINLLPEIKNKIIKSNLEKYGVEYPIQDLTRTNKGLLIKKYKDTNLYYQGSYELDFLNKYYNKLKITRGETIKYEINGEIKNYYPDFLIEDFNLLVEIKSTYVWNKHLENNLAKIKHLNENKINFILIMDKDYNELNRIIKK